ncbi:hypothetical protein, partial [Lysinibacillus agricola]|uniref:hypothetical protein n=1 Tax=Lysinibacillus agricola TaxID=2590012 RepID=UPI003C26F68B
FLFVRNHKLHLFLLDFLSPIIWVQFTYPRGVAQSPPQSTYITAYVLTNVIPKSLEAGFEPFP